MLVLTLHSHLGDGVRRIRVWGVTPGTVTALTAQQTEALAARGKVRATDVFGDAWPPAGISPSFTAVVRED